MTMGEPKRKDKCPLCNRNVSVMLLDSHVNSHLDEEELARDRAFAQKVASCSSPETVPSQGRGKREKYAVSCDRGCNQEVPIQEWESHCLQHRLALEEGVGNESRAFVDKRGVSKRARGISYGEGEWGKMSKMLRNRPLEENVRSLMSGQTKETTTAHVREGLMHLLQRCMESDQRAGFSTIALSGWVEHYESRHREDLGWGCGWRNIQMLASHLLMTDPGARDALFGGCGFVPDILSLQRWVEVAWRKGFDMPGADYFNWEIVGTHKWIGTTECAALLRSFGMRARVVDFQAFGPGRVESNRGEEVQDQNAQPKRSSLTSWKSPDSGSGSGSSQSRCGSRSRSTSRSESVSRHASPVGGEHFECSGCGEYPIQGVRYHNLEMRNADLCVACIENMRNSVNKDERDVAEGYEGVDFEPGSSSSHTQADSQETSRHQHIVDWVWNYFMERSNRTASTAASAFDRLRQPIILSKKSPLYFQHRGHSRTIVGIEKRRRPGSTEEVYLIVLDPSQKTGDIVKALREKSGWQRLLKRGLQTLKHAEYQLCYVDPGLATDDEYEKLKILSSVHYTY